MRSALTGVDRRRRWLAPATIVSVAGTKWAGLTGRDIARWRVHAQRLASLRFHSVPGVVRGLLGVQAENHGHAAWAVATRTAGVDKATFDRLFDEGAILRTHVLRPTWHYVVPDDIRWLLELTAPRIRRSFLQLQRSLNVGDRDLETSRRVILETLAGGHHLTRAALAEGLAGAGLAVDGPRMGLFTADAELAALICSGAMDGAEQTYALLDERAPEARRLERDEALAELVLRYFSGHGPATERDLAYWATMTLADVRRGLAEVGDRLESFELAGRRYWFTEPPPPPGRLEPRGHLLLILDELYRGYQESRGHIDVEGLVQPGRTLSVGMALLDGQIVGGMRRVVRSRSVRFEVLPARALARHEIEALSEAGLRQARFLGLVADVRVADRSAGIGGPATGSGYPHQ